MNPVVSVSISPGLLEVLKNRARFNQRSLSKEIIFLVETALALKAETSREFIHMLAQMGEDLSPTTRAE